jgi:hypothetical protein
MSPGIFWFLPTSGDTRHLGRSDSGRPVTARLAVEIVRISGTGGNARRARRRGPSNA